MPTKGLILGSAIAGEARVGCGGAAMTSFSALARRAMCDSRLGKLGLRAMQGGNGYDAMIGGGEDGVQIVSAIGMDVLRT